MKTLFNNLFIFQWKSRKKFFLNLPRKIYVNLSNSTNCTLWKKCLYIRNYEKNFFEFSAHSLIFFSSADSINFWYNSLCQLAIKRSLLEYSWLNFLFFCLTVVIFPRHRNASVSYTHNYHFWRKPINVMIWYYVMIFV